MRNITKNMPSFVRQPISDASWSHTLLPYYTRGNFSPPRSSGEFQAVERTISGLAWEACKGRFLWLRAQKTGVRGFAAGREPASLFSAGHHPGSRFHPVSPRNQLFSRSPVAGNRQVRFRPVTTRVLVFPVLSCFRHEISCFRMVSPEKLHVHHRQRPGTAKSFF